MQTDHQAIQPNQPKSGNKKSNTKIEASRSKRKIPNQDCHSPLPSMEQTKLNQIDNIISIDVAKEVSEEKPSKRSALKLKEEIKIMDNMKELEKCDQHEMIMKKDGDVEQIKEGNNQVESNAREYSTSKQSDNFEVKKSNKKVTTQSKKTKILPSNSKQSKTEIKDLKPTADLSLKKGQNMMNTQKTEQQPSKEQVPAMSHHKMKMSRSKSKHNVNINNVNNQDNAIQGNKKTIEEEKKLKALKSAKRSYPFQRDIDEEDTLKPKIDSSFGVKSMKKNEKSSVKEGEKSIMKNNEKSSLKSLKSEVKSSVKSVVKSGVKKVKLDNP